MAGAPILPVGVAGVSKTIDAPCAPETSARKVLYPVKAGAQFRERRGFREPESAQAERAGGSISVKCDSVRHSGDAWNHERVGFGA
jgi:hypothetical protein